MAKAGNAVIGALKVSLGIDTAQFSTGLKGAQSQLSKFSSSMKTPLAAITAAVAGVATTFAIGVKLALNRADELSKAAQKFGIPIEQLSALKYAADLADVSLESLGTGLKKLSASMASNNDAFKELGVSIRDSAGNLRPTEDVLLDVAEAFANAEDGAGKTALALKIFGKSGTDLIPFLNSGKAEIKELTDEARKLGLVIGSETGKAAEQFNDNLSRLQSVATGVFTQVAANLAPALANLTDKLVEVAKSGDLARAAVDLVNGVFKYGQSIVIEFSAALQKLNRIATFTAQVFDILAGDDPNRWDLITEAFDKMKADLLVINAETKSAIDALNRPRTGGGADISTQNKTNTGTGTKGTIQATSQVPTEGTPDFPQLIPAGYADAVEAGNRALRDQTKILNEQEALWNSIGNILENAIVGTINRMVDGTLSWKSALQSGVQILISILSTIGSQSLSNAGGWGTILPNLLGFAGGGSFKVGGSGGVDSQLVAFLASPNETVNVTKPGQDASSMTFAPVIDARGSDISESRFRAILEDFSRRIPSIVKQARVRGEL